MYNRTVRKSCPFLRKNGHIFKRSDYYDDNFNSCNPDKYTLLYLSGPFGKRYRPYRNTSTLPRVYEVGIQGTRSGYLNTKGNMFYGFTF